MAEEEFAKKVELWRKEAKAAEEALVVADVGKALNPDRLRAVTDVLERWRALSAQEQDVFDAGKGMSTPAFVLFRRLIEPHRKTPVSPPIEGEKPQRSIAPASKAFKCPFCPYEGMATNHVMNTHLDELTRQYGGIAGKWKDRPIFTDILNSIRAKFAGNTVRTEDVLDSISGFFPWIDRGNLDVIARDYLAYTSVRHGERKSTTWEVVGEKPGPPLREGVPPPSSPSQSQ